MSHLAFSSFTLNGVDAQKFLQGQVTLNVTALAENLTRYTAICSLKGRIQFGLWLKKLNPESFEIVTTARPKPKNLPSTLKSLVHFLK